MPERAHRERGRRARCGAAVEFGLDAGEFACGVHREVGSTSGSTGGAVHRCSRCCLAASAGPSHSRSGSVAELERNARRDTPGRVGNGREPSGRAMPKPKSKWITRRTAQRRRRGRRRRSRSIGHGGGRSVHFWTECRTCSPSRVDSFVARRGANSQAPGSARSGLSDCQDDRREEHHGKS